MTLLTKHTATLRLDDISNVVYDSDAKAGYILARSHLRVSRTVEVCDGLMVDLDDDGFVLGVEVIGHSPDLSDVMQVLRLCRLEFL